ncbi:SusC/RagA family TonB-linked outer membrane protein [Aestuariibaculum sp. M13]|uniref:SusC/RagA family TonB-linked outer membrane protein n=1 Tax=Aestuariibaculum sp. M13 TaxID=2967132 RepID=UPI002159FE01|nr:SusC/RagA family TonB-linked outer membrane protein [Aestuariibaculum sp. M13]MCR8668015.1 SusC/RagA family TonB-linked outer membrane protein [Aestuariibaculum sp. M13]
MSTIIKSIEQQTGYRIIYNSNKVDVTKRFTLNVTDSKLEDALNSLLKDSDIAYALISSQILLTDKKEKETTNSRLIKGKVLSAADQFPLSGAMVVIKGKSIGAMTDIDGNFIYTIKGENINNVELEASYLGMKSQTKTIGSASEFTFYLEEDISELTEVVITSSYGTKKLKEEVVGSISTVDPDNISKEQPAVTFDELLEGQVAGVLVEVNPQLGEAAKIDIRGQGSLTPLNSNAVGTSTQPLIIVDGIILSEETGIDGNSFFDLGDGILSENILNPLARVGIEDIESFNILKDAAAVGLYGADAANGVIIITTKSGEKGKLRYTASAQTGINTAFNGLKYLSGEEYQTVLNSYYTNSGNSGSVQPWNGVNTDWFDLLNTTGIFSRLNFGVSGGKGNWNYRANVGYQHTNETQKENSYKKLNTSFSADYKKDKFGLSLRLSPSLTNKENPNTLYAYALPPTLSPYDVNGEYTYFETYGNPVAVSKQNISDSKTFALLGSLKLDYDVLHNLKLSTLFGIDASNKDEDKFFSGLNGSGNFNDGSKGRRMIRARDTRKWNWNASLAYNTQFAEKHNFDALLGIEARSEKVDFSYEIGRGFTIYDSPQPIITAEQQDYEIDYTEYAGRSGFAQVNYNYAKKYFFLANFRVDQSSAFGDDNDTALNGGLGVSWNISNEGFLKKSKFVDFLRLRTSYGRTGNSRIGSYRALGLYTRQNNGYNGLDYANLSSAPNPNLGWEVNKKFNVGLDFNFLQKFKITTDFFRDNIEQQITSRDIIIESGFSSAQINGASMYNQGIEFSLNADWFKNKNFSWDTNFNFTKIKNRITDLVGLGSAFSTAEVARSQTIGYPTSAIWGYNFIGIDSATGRELYNIDGNIYDSSTVASQFDNTDWVPIGDSQPDFYGGLNNSFKLNNFTLRIIMSYTYGADMLVDRNIYDNYRILVNRNINANVYEDAWQNQGDQAVYPIISSNNRIISNSTKYLFDTSHIKLKSVNLTYNFPVNNYKLPLKTLSFFVNGSNLHYWFKDKSPKNKNGVAEFRNTYPEMRTFTLGINTTF